MSGMFFSNLLHWRLKKYPDAEGNTTIIMCAHNEEQTIAQSIQAIANQQYKRHIRPPYGKYTEKVQNAVNVRLVLWTIDSFDWNKPNAALED